ncbi:MAG: class I SAM-dependent methyltransferase [Chloroflexi bacterium]|nr:class I SAM-dependent methyltransferase [Ktedonobacteraceae bacterium]MBV9708453.1 class I SAM-dependent methyltransferase [Chloroflexota bacterium]
MSSSGQNSGENKYFIDVEHGAEMARLLDQDRFLTKAMGGLLAERSDLSGIHHVLDIGCGPGGWVQELAFCYPDIEAVGIDISVSMINFARAQAKVQHLDNASFEVGDATKPLAFADGTFDLINARLIMGFMRPEDWPRLMQECLRLLQPGGVLRLTESEGTFVNSPALETLSRMFNQALYRAKQSLSPTGYFLGVVPMLKWFLRKADYQHVRHMAHAVDFSAGTEAYQDSFKDMRALFSLGQPFLLKWGVTTKEEMEELYQQMLTEMLSEDFCGMGFLLTAWGEKPQIERG